MNLRVLFQDDDLIVVDKPAGFHVHPPEDPRHRISRATNALYLLRRQLNRYVFPVHRLDRATSGALLFALNAESASVLGQELRDRKMKKSYYAVVRGWVEDEGRIEHALRSDTNPDERKESITLFRAAARWESKVPVGRYESSRYSLVEAEPVTGRMHQIRRHFAHISHPLIGDTVYGDGKHNRAFREHLGISQLMLKAYRLEFTHPRTNERLKIQSRWDDNWHRVFEAAGLCPYAAPQLQK